MADILKTVFAKKTKFSISICKPGNTAVQFKVSHKSYLHMEKTYKVRITISNGPELIGRNVLNTRLSHSRSVGSNLKVVRPQRTEIQLGSRGTVSLPADPWQSPVGGSEAKPPKAPKYHVL